MLSPRRTNSSFCSMWPTSETAVGSTVAARAAAARIRNAPPTTTRISTTMAISATGAAAACAGVVLRLAGGVDEGLKRRLEVVGVRFAGGVARLGGVEAVAERAELVADGERVGALATDRLAQRDQRPAGAVDLGALREHRDEQRRRAGGVDPRLQRIGVDLGGELRLRRDVDRIALERVRRGVTLCAPRAPRTLANSSSASTAVVLMSRTVPRAAGRGPRSASSPGAPGRPGSASARSARPPSPRASGSASCRCRSARGGIR